VSGENHYVTPTYQALLILSIDTVAKRLMDRDAVGGWNALQTLYVELPPECQKECEKDYQAVVNKLAKFRKTNCYTVYGAKCATLSRTKAYLPQANLELFNTFKKSLFAKGYLETAATKPRNPQPTTLGE
jgi:hypothetical protein